MFDMLNESELMLLIKINSKANEYQMFPAWKRLFSSLLLLTKKLWLLYLLWFKTILSQLLHLLLYHLNV